MKKWLNLLDAAQPTLRPRTHAACAVIWNAPLLLLFGFSWSIVLITIGVNSLLIALGILVAWYARPVRPIAFEVPENTPSHPAMIYFTVAGALITGEICFLMA